MSSSTGLDTKIQLKLRRAQKTGMIGKTTFTLDARVELPADAQALVAKYQLGGLVVYDSQARRKQQEAAYSHFDEAAHSTTGRSLWKSARGLASAALMAMTLRVTVNNLMSGQHIACKDLDELLGAEAAIVEACRNLKGYLETALTFDGREELIEI
jgi:hypothetical protein